MKYVFFVVLAVTILGMGVVSASSDGIRYRQQKLSDPYDRIKYFGEGYKKPLFGFGREDAPVGNAKGPFGRRAAGSVRNKMFESLTRQGRNPARVSFFDSSIKGSRMIDTVVALKSTVELTMDGQTIATTGFARLVSEEYNPDARLPFSQIHITLTNVPPLTSEEVLGVWLVDKDTGYILRLGNFNTGLKGTGTFVYRVYQFFGPYDSLLITKEQGYSLNPLPGNDVLLTGEL